jgi:hypothetical protein
VALALVGATVRPEGIILVSAFLFDLVLKRHYKTVLIWGTIMGSLFLLSVLQIGFWIPDMLENIPKYRECCLPTDPPDVVGYSSWIGHLIRVGVAAWAGWMLWMLRPLPDLTRIPWSLSVVVIAYLLIFTQTKNYTLAYALLPIWVLLRFTHSWQRGLVMMFFFLPWLYLILDQPDGAAMPYEQLFTPLMLGGLLTYVWYQQKEALLGESGSWQQSSLSS